MAYIWQKEKYPLHLVQNPKYMNEIDKMRKSELADMEKPKVGKKIVILLGKCVLESLMNAIKELSVNNTSRFT